MAPLAHTHLGTSPGPQQEQALLPAPPSTDHSQHSHLRHPLLPAPLTHKESCEGFMGAVRAPSSPRLQGVSHQPHGGSSRTLPEPKERCQPWGSLEKSWTCGEELEVLGSDEQVP